MTAIELFCKGICDVSQCEFGPDGYIVPCSECCNHVACTMEIMAWNMAKAGVLYG